MQELRFTNPEGDFILHQAGCACGLYFPLVNEGGMMSSITPTLAGDCKTGQNTYLLPPCSAETLRDSRATRNFWLQIQQAGGAGRAELWSACGQSAAQRAAAFGNGADRVTVRGGLLWHSVTRENTRLGLSAEITSFVPAGEYGKDTVELMRVTLQNAGATSLTVTPTAAIPLYGRSADNIRDHRHVTSLLQRLRVVPEGVVLTQTLTFDERGHKPGDTVYTVYGREDSGAGPVRFLGPVQDFCGSAGGGDWPAALACPKAETPWLQSGDCCEGYEMMAVLQFNAATLVPGASRSWYLSLGIDCTGEQYLTPLAFCSALEETKRWWQDQIAADFHSGDPALDAWLRWVGIQPTLRRICGCSFLPHHDYGRGGRGWRDLWQDSLALLLRNPQAVRSDLVSFFAGVRADGTNATIIGRKPGQFLADRNQIVRVWMDHGFWPLLTVDLYLQQTGDLSILLEQQPYFCDRRKHRGEVLAEEPETTLLTDPAGRAVTGTVLEHLIVETVTAFLDAGSHGNLRLRGADWNDALDMAPDRGESVAFTAAYGGNLQTLASMCRALGRRGQPELSLAGEVADLLLTPEKEFARPETRNAARRRYETVCEQRTAGFRRVSAERAAQALEAMSRFLKDHLRRQEFVTDGGDQSWMNSYYDNDGCAVEGCINGRVRMMLTGQAFALLSGTAEGEQAREIARAADWYLNSPLRGGYCLNTDFGTEIPPLGRQFGFAYGHKENGAVFCHMAVMYAYGLYCQGLSQAGWKVLQELFDQSRAFSVSRIYPGIPEYFDPRGQGMYPYLTGAASWLICCLLTRCYGVRGEGGDLRLVPQLAPAQFDRSGTAWVDCTFAGRPLTVLYHKGECRQSAQALLEGKRWAPDGKNSFLIPRSALQGTGRLTIQITLEPEETEAQYE